jgi:hypothetical protein
VASQTLSLVMVLWKETEPESWKVHGPVSLGAQVKPAGQRSSSLTEADSSTLTTVGESGREKPALGSGPKGWPG